MGTIVSEIASSSEELQADLAYQEAILREVSRTFALTIPQLPDDLRTVVENAYLLCRIADSIEDAPGLSVEEKKRFSQLFADAVSGATPPETFVEAVCARLDEIPAPAERDLLSNAGRVLRITRTFPEDDQSALRRCVLIMVEGMESFQEGRFIHGLRDQEQLDTYCYYVAGVVGEMLTELFCSHSTAIARHQDKLARLAASFGQGLQMTNILKDIWDDKRRNVCWLPRSTFQQQGFDLTDLASDAPSAAFERGLTSLIGIARNHLKNALNYALLIPRSEWGIRKSCLWPIGMALLTLRKIHRRPQFTSGAEVKISRRSVATVIFVTNLVGRSNTLLKAAFALASLGLP